MTSREKLIEQLRMDSHTAAVVHDPANMFYLTGGYTGEGMVYISGARGVIITDFRYNEKTEKRCWQPSRCADGHRTLSEPFLMLFRTAFAIASVITLSSVGWQRYVNKSKSFDL